MGAHSDADGDQDAEKQDDDRCRAEFFHVERRGGEDFHGPDRTGQSDRPARIEALTDRYAEFVDQVAALGHADGDMVGRVLRETVADHAGDIEDTDDQNRRSARR